jgi:hypothetical protein
MSLNSSEDQPISHLQSSKSSNMYKMEQMSRETHQVGDLLMNPKRRRNI